jgi:hypothetical protein
MDTMSEATVDTDAIATNRTLAGLEWRAGSLR